MDNQTFKLLQCLIDYLQWANAGLAIIAILSLAAIIAMILKR